MSGFDNGTMQGGVYFQAKQFGSIYRGNGPPVPQAGVVGDLYVDVQTWQLFNKRSAHDGVDPWGHYLFVIPALYRTTLKWFSSSAPKNDLGVNGDYCLLWGGFGNYGLQPSIYGPKAAGAWPANPVAVAVGLNTLYTAQDVNELGEGEVGSVVAVSHTGSVLETTLATIAVPASRFAVGDMLRITTQWKFTPVGAGVWTPRIKFGGTTFFDPGALFTGATLSARNQIQIANRATNVQVGNSLTQLNFSSNTGAPVVGAVDTTLDQNIAITAQLANATDTMTLESWLVELIKPGATL